MPVSISVLPAPGNVQADREPGGSLPPATYYYTVVAVYQRAAAVVYSNQFSIPSAEVNATTNIDKASVRLQWSQVPGANNYLIYRSTSPGVVDPMEGDNCLGFAGNTNSYTDTGATALIRVVWYPWGLPKVTVTGGTEAAPNTEADIYAAFESSGLSDKLFNRHFDRYGVPDQYYFECYLHIDGALRFQKGTQISLLRLLGVDDERYLLDGLSHLGRRRYTGGARAGCRGGGEFRGQRAGCRRRRPRGSPGRPDGPLGRRLTQLRCSRRNRYMKWD